MCPQSARCLHLAGVRMSGPHAAHPAGKSGLIHTGDPTEDPQGSKSESSSMQTLWSRFTIDTLLFPLHFIRQGESQGEARIKSRDKSNMFLLEGPINSYCKR